MKHLIESIKLEESNKIIVFDLIKDKFNILKKQVILKNRINKTICSKLTKEKYIC